MTEIADDYPEPYDSLDYDPMVDDPPFREADERHDAQMSRYADEEAEAYASLPWWRRKLVDLHEWRFRRRLRRRLRNSPHLTDPALSRPTAEEQ